MNQRILVFTAETAPSFAGDGRNALLFAKTLKEKGVEVAICCLNPGGLLPSNEVIDGIEVFRIKYFHKNLLGKVFSRDLIMHFLAQKGKAFSIWMIYGAMPGYQLILFFGKVLKKKIIFRSTLCGFDDIRALVSNKNVISKCFRKLLFSNIYGYFALNSFFQEEWINFFGNKPTKIFLSPQGVDANRFAPVDLIQKKQYREKLNLPVDGFIFLTVGHMIHRKGFPELFYWLYAIQNDFCLVHVGRSKAPEWDALSVKNREMDENFKKGKELLGDKFIQVEANDNIEEYYKAADVFILSSTSEGFPSNSTNEAMSSGLPILIRNIPGYNDYVDDNVDGMVFNDRMEFLQKLLVLFEDQHMIKKLGSNARLKVINNSDIQKIAERFIEFL